MTEPPRRDPRSSSPPATAPRPASARTPRARRWPGAPRGARLRRRARASSPTTAARSRPPSSTAPARHDLVVTTGGTGLTPRDVTPAGDPGRDRLRGPRPRRGDARRRPRDRRRWPTCRAASSASAAGRSSSTCRAARRAPSNRSRPSRPCWITPSRPSPDRTITRSRRQHRRGRLTAPMFEPFAEVPAYPLVFLVFWGAAAFFVLAMARHLRVFAVARPSRPFDRTSRRGSSASSSTPSSRRRCSRTPGRRDARRHLLGLRPADDRDGQHRHRRAHPGGPVDPVRRRCCGR